MGMTLQLKRSVSISFSFDSIIYRSEFGSLRKLSLTQPRDVLIRHQIQDSLLAEKNYCKRANNHFYMRLNKLTLYSKFSDLLAGERL